VAHTLLLADDSVTIQRVIELTFADEDVQVVAVSDGDEAIARLAKTPPDIVLADVGMPGKNGYEVAQHIKTTPRLSHIPVVLLTGAFEPIDQAKAAAAGCDGVLAKPFEPQLVIGRVKELLSRSKAPVAPAQASATRPLSAASPAPSVAAASAAGASIAAAPPAPRPAPVAVPAPAAPPAPVSAPPAVAAPAPVGAAPAATLGAASMSAASSGAASAKADESADYFDRLDQALANLSKGAERGAPKAAQAVAETVDWFSSEPQKGAQAASAASSTAWNKTAPLPPRPAAVTQPAAVAQPAAIAQPPVLPPLADAFAALLAAEQTQPRSSTAPAWPIVAPPAPTISEDVIAEVVRRVLEQLSDKVMREAVAEKVSTIAERLVREEIERIKAAIK
jgi:CheY-like chemotaxis protein